MAGRGRHVAALLIMATIIATLFVLCTPRTASRSSALAPADPADTPARRVTGGPGNARVLALDCDAPIADREVRAAHHAFGWNDPRRPAAEFASDVAQASGVARDRSGARLATACRCFFG